MPYLGARDEKEFVDLLVHIDALYDYFDNDLAMKLLLLDERLFKRNMHDLYKEMRLIIEKKQDAYILQSLREIAMVKERLDIEKFGERMQRYYHPKEAPKCDDTKCIKEDTKETLEERVIKEKIRTEYPVVVEFGIYLEQARLNQPFIDDKDPPLTKEEFTKILREKVKEREEEYEGENKCCSCSVS
jgi:hypothetical protein